MKLRNLVWGIITLFYLGCGNPCDLVDCGSGSCFEGSCICPEGYEGDHCEERVKMYLKSKVSEGMTTNYAYDTLNRLIRESYDDSDDYYAYTYGNNKYSVLEDYYTYKDLVDSSEIVECLRQREYRYDKESMAFYLDYLNGGYRVFYTQDGEECDEDFDAQGKSFSKVCFEHLVEPGNKHIWKIDGFVKYERIYDDQINPYFDFRRYFNGTIGRNTIDYKNYKLKYDTEGAIIGSTLSTHTTLTYKYNTLGYPTELNAIYDSGNTRKWTFTYY